MKMALRSVFALALLLSGAFAAEPLRSPDGQVAVAFELRAADGAPLYHVLHGGQTVLRESALGLVRDDGDFSRGLKLLSS